MLVWGGQGILAVIVVVFLGRTLTAHWGELTNLEVAVAPRPGPILLSALVVLLTYALLVEAWRRVLAGWGGRIGWVAAAGVWTVSNLGRYIPGEVWTVAGLAVLAKRAGADGWAATASAATMQVLSLGTGIAVVLAIVPATAGVPVGGAAVVALAALVVIVIALISPAVVRVLDRLVPRLSLRPLPVGAVVAGVLATTAAWVTYGVAFWLLAAGLFSDPDLSVSRAVGTFTAGYIVGFLALFAPGGAGVREAAFIGLLAPTMGLPQAFALSVFSRVLLTITELVAALLGMLTRRSRGDVNDRS